MFGSLPISLAAIAISLANLEKIRPRLASIAPLKCLTFAHRLCPAISIQCSVFSNQYSVFSVQYSVLSARLFTTEYWILNTDRSTPLLLNQHRRAVAQHFGNA